MRRVTHNRTTRPIQLGQPHNLLYHGASVPIDINIHLSHSPFFFTFTRYAGINCGST